MKARSASEPSVRSQVVMVSAGAILLLMALLAGAHRLGLVTADGEGLPSCPWRAATGIACPGCGATRALIRLAGGDILGAMMMNALVTMSVVGVVILSAGTLAAPARIEPILDRAAAIARTSPGRLALGAMVLAQMILGPR